MNTIGIMANGPRDLIPDMSLYKDEVDLWIGADRGALTLIANGITPDYALGDFDSTAESEMEKIQTQAIEWILHPIEKDETDLELALMKAFQHKPKEILLFGVTGGRLDHTLINIQILHSILEKGIKGKLIDRYNQLEMTMPGVHHVEKDDHYANISFIPMTPAVTGLTLNNFYYPLKNKTVTFGSTLCISNRLLSNNGTFSYEEGILLVIKSRDVNTD